MANIVIGIEGYVGAGKTTICRNLLKKIPNSVLLNGGNLYRAIVASMMKSGKNIDDLVKNAKNIDIKQVMDKLQVKIKFENKESVFYIAGKKVDETFIQSKEISLAVSSLGGRTNEGELYKFAQNLIDDLKKQFNVIVSGRGLMNIYPRCDYHILVTADLETRVQRKASQYKNKNISEIRENVIQRDSLQEKAGYYKISEITKIVDVTNCKTSEESTNKVLDVINLKEIAAFTN